MFFLSFFSAQFSGGGAKLVFRKVVLGQKNNLFRNGWCTFLGGFEGLAACCCMMLLDALEGCSKNPIKICFLITLLLDAKETEKQEEKTRPNKFTPILGGLENGQEVAPPFSLQKGFFLKILKNPIFIVFPESGWRSLFLKRPMLQGGDF